MAIGYSSVYSSIDMSMKLNTEVSRESSMKWNKELRIVWNLNLKYLD